MLSLWCAVAAGAALLAAGPERARAHAVRHRHRAGRASQEADPLSTQEAVIDPILVDGDVPSPFEDMEGAAAEAHQNFSGSLSATGGAEAASGRDDVLGADDVPFYDEEDGDRPNGDSRLTNTLRLNPAALRDKAVAAAAQCAHDCYGNGFCENGACICKQGFTGKRCEKGACYGGCSSTSAQGTCDLATMHCADGKTEANTAAGQR